MSDVVTDKIDWRRDGVHAFARLEGFKLALRFLENNMPSRDPSDFETPNLDAFGYATVLGCLKSRTRCPCWTSLTPFGTPSLQPVSDLGPTHMGYKERGRAGLSGAWSGRERRGIHTPGPPWDIFANMKANFSQSVGSLAVRWVRTAW